MPPQPPSISSLPWRMNVGMVIINPNGCVWMGRRSGVWGYPWQFPQGGIDLGESSEQAMWRELREEVGLTAGEILGVHPRWLSYAWPHEDAIKWGYQGQKQQWFLIKHTQKDNAISINHEFGQWAWVPWQDLDQVKKTVVAPFRRDVYTAILEGPFKEKIFSTVNVKG